MSAYVPAHAAITRVFESVYGHDAAQAAHLALTALVDDEATRKALSTTRHDSVLSESTQTVYPCCVDALLAALVPPGIDQ